MISFVAIGIAVTLLAAAALGDRYFEMAKSMDVFSAIYKDLNAYYVDSLSPQGLMESAVNGMTSSLDPYTYYYTEDNLDELNFQTTGKYAGIGVSILKLGQWTVISDVYPGSPMQKLGVQPGERIYSLNGIGSKGMSLNEVSGYLRGSPGTLLHISLMNPYTHAIRHLEVHRQVIDLDPVPYAGMVSPKVGYIRFIQFTEYSSDRIRQAFMHLKATHPSMVGLILDLRGNPGGLLEEAVKIAGMYLPRGDTIVTTRGRVEEWDKAYTTSDSPIDTTIRLAILTNQYTASASEIVAGAMQDRDRAVVVGQRTFGKGLVQTTRSLPYDSKLKLTVARYYTPSGRCIQAIQYLHSSDGQTESRVPDSLQHTFYTVHGRSVKDGGGIEPDIVVSPVKVSPVGKALLEQNLIFQYATYYAYKHPKYPDSVVHLSKQDLAAFYQFVVDRHFQYTSQALSDLNSLKEDIKEHQSPAMKAALRQLSVFLKSEQEAWLQEDSKEITELLKEQIMAHYNSDAGKIRASLTSDPDILRAEGILDDDRAYHSVLHL